MPQSKQHLTLNHKTPNNKSVTCRTRICSAPRLLADRTRRKQPVDGRRGSVAQQMHQMAVPSQACETETSAATDHLQSPSASASTSHQVAQFRVSSNSTQINKHMHCNSTVRLHWSSDVARVQEGKTAPLWSWSSSMTIFLRNL